MTYLTVPEIKSAIKAAGREGDEFFQTHPTEELDELLETLEKRSRAIINNQLKGEGYEKETGRVDTVDAPDKPSIQLVYPVDNVTKVEMSGNGNDFRELDTELYSSDKQKLEIRKSLIRQSHHHGFNKRNPLNTDVNRSTWAKITQRVRITYDRGYETGNVPQGIKEVQQEMIRRMLVHYRQEQNLANLTPDEVQGFNSRQILSEDIQARIGQLTQTKSKYLMMR